jgi:hypothetical protein
VLIVINLYAHEQLMLQQQREIERSARRAWQFASFPLKRNRAEAKPAPVMAVQPAADCCTECCTA